MLARAGSHGFWKLSWVLSLVAWTAVACVRPGPGALFSSHDRDLTNQTASVPGAVDSTLNNSVSAAPLPAPAASESVDAETHIVQLGETINSIAAQYGISASDLAALNKITDANLLLPGRILQIPVAGNVVLEQGEQVVSDALSLIPDAELVYGPPAKAFDLAAVVAGYNGYLREYAEDVEGQTLSGPEIVQLVADRNSVNPRLLLAVLEYNAGWLTQSQPQEIDYPLGNVTVGLEGLYKQLSWAANQLNYGFYGRAEGGLSIITFSDDTTVPIAPGTSFGTTGVQNYLAVRDGVTLASWQEDIGPAGFLATYRNLFGDPFAYNFDPLLPENLSQPEMALPWSSGETWYFSGGPHGGWNTGSAWAALDFVPPDVEGGCLESAVWVTAVAPGQVTRSGFGAVVVDLDGDGYAGTGWAVTYMHLDNANRIETGSRVATGDRIGHPGCEGGVTNGTHLHVARTYNGRWIAADGAIPFDLDGWISEGAGYEYNGWLVRGDETKTADVMRSDDNAITAD